MPGQRVARAVRAVVVFLTLLIVLRAFATFSRWQRVVVAGGSMAPHFYGVTLAVRCETCETSWRIDPSATEPDACPGCGSSGAVAIGACPPDRVYARRVGHASPVGRFDVVVLRSPRAPANHLLKRVVGLPGERVEFVEGDAFINGARLVKPLAEQLRVRVPVAPQRQAWRIAGGEWRRARPMTDDLPYNAHVSRRVNPVRDVMIEVEASLTPGGTLSIRPGWPPGMEIRFVAPPDERGLSVQATRDERVIAESRLATDGPLSVVVSTFDRRLLVVVDAGEVISADLPETDSAPDRDPDAFEPTALQAAGGEIQEARLYRDIYYESPPEPSSWSLAADEWFVIGDNQAVSRDSRNWGAPAGVPGRLFLGVVP